MFYKGSSIKLEEKNDFRTKSSQTIIWYVKQIENQHRALRSDLILKYQAAGNYTRKRGINATRQKKRRRPPWPRASMNDDDDQTIKQKQVWSCDRIYQMHRVHCTLPISLICYQALAICCCNSTYVPRGGGRPMPGWVDGHACNTRNTCRGGGEET